MTIDEKNVDGFVLSREAIEVALRDGLMAMAVEAGMLTAQMMMQEEVEALAGGWNARDSGRVVRRGGTAPTSVVMGGQLVHTRRPRAHEFVDGERRGEVQLETLRLFRQGDLLERVAMERMLAGVATRAYEQAADPVGGTVSGRSKSSVSRRFVAGTKQLLDDLLTRDLSGLDPVVIQIDGINFGGDMIVAALITDIDGNKQIGGLVHGSTENTTVVTDLCTGMLERGLDITGGILTVIDGAKALKAAVASVFGGYTLIQRCTIHKVRNVKGYLPKDLGDSTARRLRKAFDHDDPVKGRRLAVQIVKELERSYPSAAASLRSVPVWGLPVVQA